MKENTKIKTLIEKLKIKFISWNFSESGHGKGAMDSVGGSLKRNADRFARQGNDITSAKEFVTVFNDIKDSKTKVVLIEDHKIDELKKELPKKIPSVPNIMNVHQVTYCKDLPMSRIFLRNLSCFECPFDSISQHFPANKTFVDFVLLGQDVDESILDQNVSLTGDEDEIDGDLKLVTVNQEKTGEKLGRNDDENILEHDDHRIENEDDCYAGLELELTNDEVSNQHSSTMSEIKSHDSNLPDGESSEDFIDIKTEDWVAVMYEDNWYPGVVKQVNKQNITVNFLALLRHSLQD